MNKSKHTGTKLSEYPTSLSNKKHKLLYNHFFMSYAPVNFGISTVNKNYKIPIQAIRDDIKYYIGLENAKGDWQNMIHFWSGDWFNEDITESYVTPWTHEERGSVDYIKNKYGLEDDEDKIDRIFFIKDAPIPLEEEHEDPNPLTNKFVNKKYIDDRFNGIRKVSVTGETLAIRPYSCVYEFENTPTTINIVDTEELQDGRTVAECIKGNILTFIIKFNVGDSDILAIYANGEHNIKWSYPTEFQDIVKAAKENNNSDVWLQCYVGYTEQGLSIRCSSALHPMPGSHEPPKVTDEVTDGDTKVPTADAVYDFVKEEIKPKLEEVVAGDFIGVKNKNEVFVKTATNITNDATTVPTTKAVFDSIEELIVSEEYDEIIFDLGNIFYEQINKPWVESMVILSRDNYVYPNSTFTLLRDSLHIPHAEKYYPNPGTLTITGISKSNNPATPTITASGFELSDVAKNAISERLKYVAKKYSQDSLTLEIARLEQSVPRKAQWVKDAKDGNLKTALAFTIDDPHTTEILRMFFYYLDQENGRTWGADDSYSKKYMIPGLTFKCLSNTPSGFLHESSEISNEYSYTYRTWLGKGNSDKNLISWNTIIPNYINYFDWSNYVPFNGEDAFHISTCWDLLVNKSSFDVLINELQTDMAELFISDEYNEFVFDLSNIFYEQINKQWCEIIVTLSENEIEIPYKEKYYTNVGSLKISGITAGDNPSTPTVTASGFSLPTYVIAAIQQKLINVAKTGNQNTLNSVITNYQNDIPYKAAWVRDAKALNIPTQLAFRHSSYRTNEILRMFFYYLDQENGKTWGADDSYSKKYMVPGLTYKCLTRPDTTFPADQYYSYVYNIWLGDRGNTDRTLIAWNYEPSYLTIGSYPNESHGANWDGDSFTMPINWDTLVNEQAWDSFITDYKAFKTTTEPHVANKEIHLTPEEKAQLFKAKFVVTSKPDLTGSQSTGNVGGFVLEPTSDVKTDKIVMKGISNLVSNILYIWKDTADGVVTVLQNPNKSIVDETTHTWNFNETLTFNANERYYFTWHNAVNSNAIAPPKPAERGHIPSVQKYSHVNGQIFALNTTQYFTSADVDREHTVDCAFYMIDGVETISPSTESVELISEDVNELKTDFEEHLDDYSEHKSDLTSHITNVERNTWNTDISNLKSKTSDLESDLEEHNINYNILNTQVKNIIGNEDFVFNNYNPAIHTLNYHQGYTLVFTKKHFFVGKLLNIIIPHNSGGSGVKGGYLAIQVYKELNNPSEVPTTYYSENTCDYVASSGGYRYNFENCVLDDYAEVHLTVVSDKTVVPPYKPDSNTDFDKISKIRFAVLKKNGSENESSILGENDGCGVYWDTSGNIVDKLPYVAINKLAVKLVENYDFSEETDNELKLVQETISLGESNINQDSNSKCFGITFIAQENTIVDTLIIKTANSGYFTKVENLYAIIQEEQEDGTKKEIASMETPVNLPSSNTQYKLTFYPFVITKDKKYFVEFIQKNAETGSFNATRTQVNLGLINDTQASGVLSYESRSSWNVSYVNQYSPILKLSQETYIMGNLILRNDMECSLSLVAKINDTDASNIVLLKPFVTASTDIEIESTTNGHVMGIILKKNENTPLGEHYLGIKTLYVDKETNEIKELLTHSKLTII